MTDLLPGDDLDPFAISGDHETRPPTTPPQAYPWAVGGDGA